MKKTVSLILAVVMLFALGTTALAATGSRKVTVDYCGIKIVVDGREVVPLTVDGNAVEPFAISGTTYLPVRAIAGALGLGVQWNGETNTVLLSSGYAPNYGSGTALATKGSKVVSALYQNIKITLDGAVITPKDAAGKTVEPFVLDGTTYLPVRAVANALGAEVSWDAATNTVTLNSGMIPLLVKRTVSSLDAEGSRTEYFTVTYAYDEAHNCISEVSSGSRESTVTSRYDANGNILTRMETTPEETTTTEYTYDDEGKIISCEGKSVPTPVENGTAEVSGDSIFSITYAYDSNGFLVKEYHYFNCSGGNSYSYQYLYFNDENGRHTGYVQTGTEDDIDVLIISTSTLDKSGNETSTFLRNMNTGTSFDSVYTYDKNGNILTSTHSDLSSGGVRTTAKVTNTYDKYGNLLTRTEVYSSGGTTETCVTSRTYDSSGRLTREIFSGGDGTSDSSGYVSTYKYSVVGSNSTCTTVFGDGTVRTETCEYEMVRK